MLEKLESDWSYIKQRAFEVGSKLIQNHNDIEDPLFRGILKGLSSAILKRKLQKATDQEVYAKYQADFVLLKPFIDEFEEFSGLEQVQRDFKYPKFGSQTKFKSIFED